MSIRDQDASVLDWLRKLAARVDRLEKGDKSVRVNATRLGETVLEPNPYTHQMNMTNLRDGYVTPLGYRESVWSWPGLLDSGADTLLSPPECMPDTTIAHEIVLARSNTEGCVTVHVNFPGGFTISTIIQDGQAVRVRPIHIALNKNDLVYVTLGTYNGSPLNLSAIVRYGQPSELADNDTIEGCGY